MSLIIDAENKPLSKHDKATLIVSACVMVIAGLVSLWCDNYWLLKMWFSYKVLAWLFNFITDSIQDKKQINIIK